MPAPVLVKMCDGIQFTNPVGVSQPADHHVVVVPVARPRSVGSSATGSVSPALIFVLLFIPLHPPCVIRSSRFSTIAHTATVSHGGSCEMQRL